MTYAAYPDAVMKFLHDLSSNEFVRFLVVGAINSVFGYSVFAAFLFIGLHYTIALLAATVLGVLFNFLTTGRLVFNSRDNRLLAHFAGTYLIIYAIHIGCLKLLVSLGFSTYIGGALLVIPMALLAYILNKRFVFTHD